MNVAIDPILDSLTVEGMTAHCDSEMARAKKLMDGIKKLASNPDQEVTWEQSFGAMDDIAYCLLEACSVPELLAVAHPESAVREAAMQCQPKVDAFSTELYMDKEVFQVLKRYANAQGKANATDVSEELASVRARFIEHTLRDYRRNGLDLPEEQAKRLRELNEQLTNLGQQFEHNLAEETLSLSILPDQLEGLPESYISNHPIAEDGTVTITTNYPDYIPFMTYAQDRDAAMELYRLAQSRAAEKNLPLLDTILRLRNEKAKLLGYETWADYVLEPRMAKQAKNVQDFLQELHNALVPKREKEFEMIQEEARATGIMQPDGSVRASDAAYLEDRICAKQFAFDSQHVRNYFEINRVREGIFAIASEIFGISFLPSFMTVWDKDVQAYEVRDTESGTMIGYLYMDLYPREGKYKHAAMFGLRRASRAGDGSRVLPHAALVCNFPKPGETPALLSHKEVTTFFHEFGHALHALFSDAPLVSFGGTSCAWDFVEVPSQAFEEWAWQRDVLDRFAVHAETGERIPDDVYIAMITARTFGLAMATERQIFLAMLDQTYHTSAPGIDTTAVMNTLHTQYSSFARIPNTFFQATFSHLIGYDAAYYGYQWALSIARDILTRFETEGFTNRDTAAAYRSCILKKGGAEDETEQIHCFLERPPTADAYKKFLGIN